MNEEMNVFCSWSGGKDSCLAMYKAMNDGKNKKVKFLLNFAVDGRSHGLNKEIIKSQAECIGIPLIQKVTTWADYENDFDIEVSKLKEKGISGIVAGDIDLQCHLDWVKNKCERFDMMCFEMLWKRDREEILKEFTSNGFKAIVVFTNEKAKNLLGKVIDKENLNLFIEEAKALCIDVCGENGEFHTLVVDGPIFKKKIEILESEIKEVKIKGPKNKFENKYVLDIKKWVLKEKKGNM